MVKQGNQEDSASRSQPVSAPKSALGEAGGSGGFTLDTSGYVIMNGLPSRWHNLSPFEQGYIEAALRSAQLAIWANPAKYGSFTRVGFRHLAPATLAGMLKDCADVLSLAAHAHLNTVEAGREFWARRQAGRYDPKIAPPRRLSLNDEGKIVSEAKDG